MADTVPIHFVKQFGTSVRLLAQQMDSKLSRSVMIKPITGEEVTFEQLGSVSAYEIVGRNSPTQMQTTTHSRRWVQPRDYAVPQLVDWTDDYKRIVDISGPYAMQQAASINRLKDKIIVAAFTSTAKADKTGSTSVAWSPTAYNGANHTTSQLYIPHDLAEQGAVDHTGLTIAKLRAARTILMRRNVNTPGPWYLACTTTQIQDLLMDPQCTSTDYANVKALLDGQIKGFYGFDFIEINLPSSEGGLAIATGVERQCFAYTSQAIGAAVAREFRTTMDVRADLHHSLQITSYYSGGAARVDENEIVEIRCEEPAAAS